MATPLTDSINALTQYANETTGKQDTTLSDAVGSLVEGYGGGDPFIAINPFVNIISFKCEEDILPSTITIDITDLLYLGLPRDWNIDSGLRHVIISGDKLIDFTNNINFQQDGSKCCVGAYQNRGIKDITFVDGLKLTGQLNQMFSYYYDLEAIYGEIDFTNVPSWTYNTVFTGCAKLMHIRLKPNSASVISTIPFSGLSALDDESLVSISNGLAVVSDTHTLKLHATPKARCSTITGTNDNGTFVADENGTLTLADFITTVKRWTLA